VNLFDKFALALPYADFLARYANEGQKQRWRQVHEQVALTPAQRELLGAFSRSMNVLCLAGAWCGDCINQCPIFEHFAGATPLIQVRYLDRDDHPDAQRELRINAGDRVPVLVFFSEDGQEAARYGERTLSKYRLMMRDHLGSKGAKGIVAPEEPLLPHVTQDWLNEFERVQWLLRLSPRLRQKYGD
jgi:hypothetical protein